MIEPEAHDTVSHLRLIEDQQPDSLHVWRYTLGDKEFAQYQADINRIAALTGPVLITGGSGTGKSTLAEEIHRRSPRSDYPMHRWGCGELDSGLTEATLFGHTAQAFTGARKAAPGLIQAAHQGTLILDDIDYGS